MAIWGVSWWLPPKGIRTVAAPMVESNRSLRPFLLQTFRSPTMLFIFSPKVLPAHWGCQTDAFSMWAFWCFSAPLELRNSRLMSTMVAPFQTILSRFSSVTVATGVASRFSSPASAMNLSTSSGARATAIRSWLSLMASSVPSRPSYFLVTLFRSMNRPSASSPMATDTPPAPKSLQRLIIRQASSRRKSRCSLRSMGGLPFCTSAPQCSRLVWLWALEEPVAPPMPSRPVRPPSRTMTSPGAGHSRRTWLAGVAPTTAPISIRLAT